MSPASYLLTILAAASYAFGVGLPSCKPSQSLLAQSIPAGQTTLKVSTKPTSFVLLGVGYQNYTCNDSGKFASAGAVADLFDISCTAKTPAAAANVADMSFKMWTRLGKIAEAIAPVIGQRVAAGKHYFTKTATGIAPVWDSRSFGPANLKGKANAFVLASKTGNIPAPKSPELNVDWLQLVSAEGDLGDDIYRLETRGGPAPATCKPGATTRVKYTSVYVIAGSTV